jgi:hypothetical protein
MERAPKNKPEPIRATDVSDEVLLEVLLRLESDPGMVQRFEIVDPDTENLVADFYISCIKEDGHLYWQLEGLTRRQYKQILHDSHWVQVPPDIYRLEIN